MKTEDEFSWWLANGAVRETTKQVVYHQRHKQTKFSTRMKKFSPFICFSHFLVVQFHTHELSVKRIFLALFQSNVILIEKQFKRLSPGGGSLKVFRLNFLNSRRLSKILEDFSQLSIKIQRVCLIHSNFLFALSEATR